MAGRQTAVGTVAVLAIAGLAFGLLGRSLGSATLTGLVLLGCSIAVVVRCLRAVPGTAVDTLIAAAFAGVTSGWVFLLADGSSSFSQATAIGLVAAAIGVAIAVFLWRSERTRAAGTSDRSRRWWRLYFLALFPTVFMLAVVAIFALQASSSTHAAQSLETVAWAAAAVICVPASVSLEWIAAGWRTLVAWVAVFVIPVLAVTLIGTDDPFRGTCAVLAAAFLGISLATASEQPTRDHLPASPAYRRTMLLIATIGITAGFAVLASVLLIRNM